MYNLKIIVDEIKGFCDLPMKVGNYFEVKGGKIIIPDGKYIFLWVLQSMTPLLPLKQRKIIDENDWVPYTKKKCCMKGIVQIAFHAALFLNPYITCSVFRYQCEYKLHSAFF